MTVYSNFSVLAHAENGRVSELVDALKRYPGLMECKDEVACLRARPYITAG